MIIFICKARKNVSASAFMCQEPVTGGGENYGQGSSREQAAINPMFLGVKCVIAKSIARIHKGNLINHGVIPMLFTNPSDYDKIEQGDTLEII
ncbi:MAG: hypothetical protein IJ587_07750 [Synergistaceae bacterium]|nr:hypothetical protein [Synergistaceae bacterium]